jgi:hypothetical protein
VCKGYVRRAGDTKGMVCNPKVHRQMSMHCDAGAMFRVPSGVAGALSHQLYK